MFFEFAFFIAVILVFIMAVLHAGACSRVRMLMVQVDRLDRTNAQLYREIALYQRTLPDYVVRGIEKKAGRE